MMTKAALALGVGLLVMAELAACAPQYESGPLRMSPGEVPVNANPAETSERTTVSPVETPQTISIIEGSPQSQPTPASQQSTGRPGEKPSGPPAGETREPSEEAPAVDEWLTYHDPTYGFTIQYPATYAVMQPTPPPEAQPRPQAQVTFQDRAIAESEMGGLEPPDLAVRIFDDPLGLSAEEWAVDNGLVAADEAANFQPYQAGGVDGVRLCLMQTIAPNCMIFLGYKGNIYELVPYGPLADEMLARFGFRQ